MNITYIYYDDPQDSNSFEWRCGVPARAVQRSGRHTADFLSMQDFIMHNDTARTVCEPADVIVVHRRLLGPVLSAVQRWKAYDKKVVVNLDSAVHLLTDQMEDYDFWHEGQVDYPNGHQIFGRNPINPLPVEQFQWGLRLVDGAVLPSERLADDLRELTESVHLPNFLELDRYRNQTALAHEGIVIGLGGDGNLYPGLMKSGVIEALRNVCLQRPEVRVVVAGGDQRVYDRLKVPEDQKRLWPWMPHSEWPRYLARIDIGLSPISGEFDQRRGWERVLEYMIMKIPWIASEGPVYRSLAPYGWFVPNNEVAWERILLEMVDHLSDYRAEASGEPYLFALSQDIDENLNKILMAYE